MRVMKLMLPNNGETGFTLIEALIAFIVLTVGILGALLFHSQVLRGSADSKARLEALKLAEQYIERQRAQVYSNFTGLSTALQSLHTTSQSQVSGTNATYNLSFSQPSLVSGSDSTIEQQITLSWDSDNSVSLSSFYSWVDPKTTLPADEVDDGSGGDYDNTQIPVPTGTLEIVAREELQVLDDQDQIITPTVEGGNVGTYQADDGETYVVIDLGANKVRVAKLTDSANEIMTISGKIYNNWSGVYENRRLAVPFGYVFKRKDSEGADIPADDQIIDIRATGGAVCVIDDDFVNDDSGVYGLEATYICVAGTGWNGTIYPYKKDSTANTLTDFDLQEATDSLVCSPRQRSYRYSLLSVKKLPDLEDDINTKDHIVSTPYLSITDMVSAAGGLQIGQSGLVRFTSASSPSGEKVSWDSYFWHNPDYIVSPTASTAIGVNFLVDGVSAEGGYKVPPYTSTAAGSYSVNLPGDVAYQNFVFAVESAKIGGTGSAVTWDCGDVITTALNTFASGAASASRINHEFMFARGMLGFKSSPVGTGEFGYIPVSSGNPSPYSIDYSVDDYNQFVWTDVSKNATPDWEAGSRGSAVLGYALATDRVSGTLTVPMGTDVSASTFKFGGNPEPIISVNCEPDTTNSTTVSGNTQYPYTCSVPSNWSGSIVVYNEEEPGESCVDTSIVIPADDDGKTVSELANLDPPDDYDPWEIFVLSIRYGEFGTVSSGSISVSDMAYQADVVAGDENKDLNIAACP